MDNATVTYTGQAFPASARFGHPVDWTNEVEKGLNRVRAKFHSSRGDHVIIRSNRSGSLFCVATVDWKKCGGQVPA